LYVAPRVAAVASGRAVDLNSRRTGRAPRRARAWLSADLHGGGSPAIARHSDASVPTTCRHSDGWSASPHSPMAITSHTTAAAAGTLRLRRRRRPPVPASAASTCPGGTCRDRASNTCPSGVSNREQLDNGRPWPVSFIAQASLR
jgi:hypothetical protein